MNSSQEQQLQGRPKAVARRGLTLRQQGILNSYLFIAPFYILFFIFIVVPFFWGIGLSFAQGGILSAPVFVGFDNYSRILQDYRVQTVLFNTLRYVVTIVPTSLVLGIIFALLINHHWTRWPGAMRAILFFPALASGAAIAQIWSYILLPHYGILSFALTKIGLPDIKWLTDPRMAPYSVALLTVWAGVGFQTLVLSAALKNIPGELLDAARIDGAGGYNLFVRIKLPLIQPVVLFVVVISTIGVFQIFDSVYVLTQGGPQFSTQTIVGLIYSYAFQSRQSEGLAAALGVFLFLIIMPVSLFQMFFLRSNVQY